MQISTQVGRPSVAPPNGAGPEELDDTGLVESEFLKKFREKFVGDVEADPRPWPRASVTTAAEWTSEFTAVLRAMFQLKEGGIAPPEGEAGSAKQMIRELIAETNWPNGPTVPVPAPWLARRSDTFRRYECAAAVMILMKEFDRRKFAGGSEGFPPTRPT